MFYSLFLYGTVYWVFKNMPLEIVGGGLKWYEYVRSRGLVACVRVRTMGEGGQLFVILVRTY